MQKELEGQLKVQEARKAKLRAETQRKAQLREQTQGKVQQTNQNETQDLQKGHQFTSLEEAVNNWIHSKERLIRLQQKDFKLTYGARSKCLFHI